MENKLKKHKLLIVRKIIMELPHAHDEIELYLKIDDGYKYMECFSVDTDYPDSEYDEMNTVSVSITTDTETIAYMEVYVFYEDRINDLEMFADGISGDAHSTMCALSENGLLDPFDLDLFALDVESFDEIFDCISNVIAHLSYIAVRDDYRKKGIGDWLLRNLPKILSRNYGISPRIISTTICPQNISWNKSEEPYFSQQRENTPTHEAMYSLMVKLFTKNGYQQLGDTDHYCYNKFNKNIKN
jgi:GNAT superfamily N-acetyltransferase